MYSERSANSRYMYSVKAMYHQWRDQEIKIPNESYESSQKEMQLKFSYRDNSHHTAAVNTKRDNSLIAKLSLYLIKQHAMKTYVEVEVYFHHSWPRH